MMMMMMTIVLYFIVMQRFRVAHRRISQESLEFPWYTKKILIQVTSGIFYVIKTRSLDNAIREWLSHLVL